MKKLLILAIAGVALLTLPAAQLRADDDDSGPPGQKKKGVPPGLQKKGGLPPGQAKKQSTPTEASPTQPAPATPAPAGTGGTQPATPATTPAPTPSAPAATPTSAQPVPTSPTTPETPGSASTSPGKQYDKDVLERRARLNKRVEDLDAMGRHPEVRDRMFARMYRRSDIPISTLEAQEKAHPEAGVGGIMIANTIAKHAKVPVDQVYAEHKTGKSWGEIANERKVNVADLLEKTADYEASARDAEHDASRVAARAGTQTTASPIKVQAREPAVNISTPTPPTPPTVPSVQVPAPPVQVITPPKPPAVDVTAVSSAAASEKQYGKDVMERRAKLNEHVAELDSMGQRPEVRDRMFARMYSRSQIPISTLESQEKAHPEAGIGGIMIANTIAKLSKVPVDQVFAEHKSGKNWGEIANARKVSVADLLEKVSDYRASAKDAEHDAAPKRR